MQWLVMENPRTVHWLLLAVLGATIVGAAAAMIAHMTGVFH